MRYQGDLIFIGYYSNHMLFFCLHEGVMKNCNPSLRCSYLLAHRLLSGI
jgi:hypothetical protein